jgi:hypothetical protein
MHSRFRSYRNTELGKSIETSARKPERLIEYRLLSRLQMPAVVALSWDVGPLLRDLSESDRREAKQFCGAVVGDIMRENGYGIVNARGSAQSGGVFTLGAVWAPVDEDHQRTMQIALEVMEKYKDTFEALAKS